MSCRSRKKEIVCLLLAVMILATLCCFGCAEHSVTEAVSAPSDGVFRVLLLGEDEASGLCDAVMLVSVNAENGRVAVLQIPRDTYFRYTDKNYKKINGAVRALGGAETFCRLLGSALATEIHGYIKLDLNCVKSAVDMLGGVEIDVPRDMDYDDPAQGLSIHLKAGRQRLTGEEATQFIRYRAGYLRGDVERIDAQKLFLAAFLRAAKNVEAADIPRLAALGTRSVQTNISLPRMISLFRLATSVRAESVTLVTLPGEEVRSEYSGAWYYIASREGLATVLENCFDVHGASSAIDPAHLFSDEARNDFENVYRRNILPRYYRVDSDLGGSE